MTEDIKNTTSETGTSNLLIGSGVGVYGAATLAATGAVCPTCLIVAPALLGYGAYQRYKSKKIQKEQSEDKVLSVE